MDSRSELLNNPLLSRVYYAYLWCTIHSITSVKKWIIMQFLRGGKEEKCVGYPAKKALQTTQMKYCNGVFDAFWTFFVAVVCVSFSKLWNERERERNKFIKKLIKQKIMSEILQLSNYQKGWTITKNKQTNVLAHFKFYPITQKS